MILNSLLIGLIVVITLIGIIIFLKNDGSGTTQYDIDEDRYQLERIIEYTKEQFNEILRTNLYELNITKDEFDKRIHNRRQLRKALKSCSYGDILAKKYVKSFIRDILVNNYKINEMNINKIINFDNIKELSVEDLFDILLLIYKKDYGYDGLNQLIDEHQLDSLKPVDGGEAYYITSEEILEVYKKVGKKLVRFEDKLEMIVQKIYQRYKGYSVIDEIRDMKIDGVSGGVSGIPPTFHEEIDHNSAVNITKNLPFSHDSVWIFYKGKTIHLAFLSFGTKKELIRVCKNIYRYNSPGQLSEVDGYKINEMKDGSRVVVARPPFSESWVFFVRKFNSVKKTEIENLIVDRNNELPISLIMWLIKGCRVTAITGSQGTGKTTLLMSIVKYINPAFTLRIQEMSFELHLRKIYPFRNILTFRETDAISGQEGLDLQKKTDGVVNILGEVATAPVSSWLVQMSLVASLFTIFTHHAKTTENLILSLRNNLLQTGVFSNEAVAEQQVAEVINFDIHLNKSIDGHRYIERITEIIPLTLYSDYPKAYRETDNFENKVECFMDTMTTYFERVTDRKTFMIRDIVRFNHGSYEWINEPTEHSVDQIKRYLSVQEREAFQEFLSTCSNKEEGYG